MAAGRGVISKGALPMKSQSGLSVWIRLRNSQRQSDEMKNPVRSFTQLLGWSLLSRTGENRQLFRTAKMTPGSRFLTTPNFWLLLTSAKQKSQRIIRKSYNTLAIPVILLGTGTVEVMHQLSNVRVIPVLLSRRWHTAVFCILILPYNERFIPRPDVNFPTKGSYQDTGIVVFGSHTFWWPSTLISPPSKFSLLIRGEKLYLFYIEKVQKLSP